MQKDLLLGIDAGGTHTDAVLLEIDGGAPRLVARAKAPTRHDDLPGSISEVLDALCGGAGESRLASVTAVTLGTTLIVNALVQGKADEVGLLLTAGPGLSPERFTLGRHWRVLEGGLDHRGTEVVPLDGRELAALPGIVDRWRVAGVSALACVGKFSPRNPAQEKAVAQAAEKAGLPVTMGHRLSGRLNFPRRIATAYYNAAVGRLHASFLDAVEKVLAEKGVSARIRLLKADGGAVPATLSREEPVRSILSGPAASAMGVMAMDRTLDRGVSLLLDMGGTTTDIAVFIDGSPVVDRDGMLLDGRRTLVRALATDSIGVGGDSLISVSGDGDAAAVSTGPLREGPAMAFGGERPTLLDALNLLDRAAGSAVENRGDLAASLRGVEALARMHGLAPGALAKQAVDDALAHVHQAASALLDRLSDHPVYTLAALRAAGRIAPDRVLLVGGPAACIRSRIEKTFGLPVVLPPDADVANAVGAALTLPTASLEIYADTSRARLRAPSLDHEEPLGRGFTLEAAKKRAMELLTAHMAASGAQGAQVEVTEADIFATLDDGGRGSHDIRVSCQAVPGIAGRL